MELDTGLRNLKVICDGNDEEYWIPDQVGNDREAPDYPANNQNGSS